MLVELVEGYKGFRTWNVEPEEWMKVLGLELSEIEVLFFDVGLVNGEEVETDKRRSVPVAIVIHDRLQVEIVDAILSMKGRYYIEKETFDKLF